MNIIDEIQDYKSITEIGKQLGAAIDLDDTEEINKIWGKVVKNSSALVEIVSKLATKGDMSQSEFIKRLHYVANVKKTKDTGVGASALIDILKLAGVVQEVNKSLRAYPISSEDVFIQNRLVFVVMAFTSDMNPIYDGMKSAASKFDFDARRVIDSDDSDYKITDRIMKMIETSNFILADLTHDRPNVYFELGYARGLGKTVYSFAREETQLHFDVKDWNTTFYTDSRVVEEELIKILSKKYKILK